MRYSNFPASLFDIMIKDTVKYFIGNYYFKRQADSNYCVYKTLNAFIFQVLIANSVVTVLVGSMVVLDLIAGPHLMDAKDVAQHPMEMKIHN